MKSRKGFTLVELMVVILIVGILAAVAIPLMRGRIDSAKWTEGKAMLGTVATAIRAYAAEKDSAGTYGTSLPLIDALGFVASDFDGTYFLSTNFSWVTAFDTATKVLTFTITATAGTGINSPTQVTLNNAGIFTP